MLFISLHLMDIYYLNLVMTKNKFNSHLSCKFIFNLLIILLNCTNCCPPRTKHDSECRVNLYLL